MKDKNLKICYGVIADPISKQLKEQGFNLDKKQLEYFDRIKDALNTLQFNGLTTDSMHSQLVQRADKYIVKRVQEWYWKQAKELGNNGR